MLSGLHKKTCSRICSNKHREGIKYKIGRPRDKAETFRVLKIRLSEEGKKVCERCSYGKQEILQIHHKNRNRTDNSLENLEILCPNCHYEEHIFKKVI
jgi:5-methylcytosine-specific restriction endonuclease McrA